MNFLITILVLLMTGFFLYSYWNNKYHHEYLGFPFNLITELNITLASWFVLLANFVPITLPMTIEIIKIF